MNEEFSEEQNVELLIEEVEKNPILYNCENKAFLEVHKKDMIWTELSLKYNINAKRRFRSLRDRYVKEKKKIDQQLLITKTVDYPNWRYYPYLTFLDKYVRKKNNRQQKTKSIDLNSLQVDIQNNNPIEDINELDYYDCSNNCDLVENLNTSDFMKKNDIDKKIKLEELNLESKCGQIYIEKGNFIYLCDFCEYLFKDINIFTDHILNYHKLNCLMDENIKENTLFDETNEIEDLNSKDVINSKIDDPLKYEIEFLDENLSNNIDNSTISECNDDINDNINIDKSVNKYVVNYEKPPKLLNDNNQYPCTQCDKAYNIYKSLRDHFRINHTSKCEYCLEKFGNLNALQIHLIDQHPDMMKQNTNSNKLHKEFIDLNEKDELNENSIESNEKSIESNEKSIGLNEKSIKLNENSIKLNETSIGLNDKSFEFNKEKSIEFNINDINEINFDLPTSTSTSTSILISNEPVKMKDQNGRYICTMCDDVTYARFENIKKHYRFIHLEVAKSRYYCDQCDKNYYSRSQLTAHKNIHKGLRPYKCHICEADFTHPQYLNFHIRVHLGDKRYPCKYCGKKFIRPYERIYHERSNHTKEKLFQCDDCGQTFIKNSQLNRHKNLKHNPNYVRRLYECDICEKKFTTKESMQKHKLIHDGKKPVECDICGSRFRTRHDVNVHKKIHSDIKNYVCKICDKRFAQGPGLYSHMKSHGIALSSKKDSNILS